MLHTTTELAVGDLFVNKYFSASYNRDVLQVWLLKAAEGGGFKWSQVCYIHVSNYAAGDHCIININRFPRLARHHTRNSRDSFSPFNPLI